MRVRRGFFLISPDPAPACEAERSLVHGTKRPTDRSTSPVSPKPPTCSWFFSFPYLIFIKGPRTCSPSATLNPAHSAAARANFPALLLLKSKWTYPFFCESSAGEFLPRQGCERQRLDRNNQKGRCQGRFDSIPPPPPLRERHGRAHSLFLGL